MASNYWISVCDYCGEPASSILNDKHACCSSRNCYAVLFESAYHRTFGSAMLTRRRDHKEWKDRSRAQGFDMPCGDQIIGGIIFCNSAEGREQWIRRLNKRHPSRFNHFVCFRDVQSDYALQFGSAEWSSVERPYILR